MLGTSGLLKVFTCGTGDKEVLSFVKVLKIGPCLEGQLVPEMCHGVSVVFVVPPLYYVHFTLVTIRIPGVSSREERKVDKDFIQTLTKCHTYSDHVFEVKEEMDQVPLHEKNVVDN